MKVLYLEKTVEMERERNKLDAMYNERTALGKSLTDHGILEQNQSCSDISLAVAELKKMLDEFEE